MMKLVKWLYPGMHVKRWLALLMVGIVVISLGIGYVLREVYEFYTFPGFVYYLTLQFLPRYVRAALFFISGVGVIGLAIWQLNRSLLAALLPAGRDDSLVDIVYQHRYLKRGPKVVAIGGGTGLSTLLRGLKEYTSNLTAIVTVADDGGSSGRLRRELGVLPPGDFRQCIVALADAEPLVTKLFQYRFAEGTGLEGHSFGNLFIAAMESVTGNFERAIRESSRVLAVRGQILPSSLANVTLCAEFHDQEQVHGESQIPSARKPIKLVFLRPQRPPAHPEALRAILHADLIVIGPGSLYTSILPNLLVEEITRAIRASNALKVYVCNVATQRGETDGFQVLDHIRALERQLGGSLFQFVLVNNNFRVPIDPALGVTPVGLDGDLQNAPGFKVVLADLVDEDNPLRHNAKKLGQSLMRIFYDKAPLAEAPAEATVPETIS